ncbi:MAG: NUDIX domain-containing protein [Candidatus Nanopelagicaceae bacterium]|nr:NUDIX domain-containing protein [Candidatus Nanopelagicaceae bacterium]
MSRTSGEDGLAAKKTLPSSPIPAPRAPKPHPTPKPGPVKTGVKKSENKSPGAKPGEVKPGDLKTKKSSPKKATKPDKSKNSNTSRRVEEISAGGLVVDLSGKRGLLIGRHDKRGRTLWSLPKGHIEVGETPEAAALREVEEETGIISKITRSLGVIDFWFMAEGKRIHKTVHHFLFAEVSGDLSPQISEVDVVDWFPLDEIATRLAYPDERKLIARSGDLRKP